MAIMTTKKSINAYPFMIFDYAVYYKEFMLIADHQDLL